MKKKVRFALSTSEVNFVKNNNSALLEELLEKKRNGFAALIVVKTITPSLLLKIPALALMGCSGIAGILTKNIVRNLVSDPFRKFREAGIPVWKTESINEEATREFLKTLDLDLIINVRTRNIFGKKTLSIPRLGCINIHHGVLPKYRGTMCDLWALADDRAPGYSLHWMNAKIDDGDILIAREVDIGGIKEYPQIPYLSSLAEAKDLIEILNRLEEDDRISSVPNRSEAVQFTRNPTWRQIRELRAKGIRL